MKKITFLVLLCTLFSLASTAQSYYYLSGVGSDAPFYSGLPGTYTTIMSSDRTDPTSEVNDVMSATQTLPFTFNFYGTDFTSYKLSDNGYITFDVTSTVSNNSNTLLPNTSAPTNAIMAFWDDLEFEQNGAYLFAAISSTEGTAPNRSHVIKWFQANHVNRAAEIDELLYFAIVLHEQGGFDIIHEGDLLIKTEYAESGTIGINNGDGTEGITIEGPSTEFPKVSSSDMNDDKVYSFFSGVQQNKDIGITGVVITEDAILTAGAVPITTAVRNYGSETITSFDLSYSINGGTLITDNYVTNIAPGETKGFRQTTAWTPANAGEFTVVVSCSNPNSSADENMENDGSQTRTVTVYSSAYDRLPLYEIFTSSTCGPCKAGNAKFDGIIAGKDDQATYIKYQQNFPGSGDPYASNESVTRRNYYGVNSIPRMEIDGEWDKNASSFTTTLHDQYRGKFSLIELSATMDKWHQEVLTKITVNTARDMSGVSLYAAVIETSNINNVKSNGETEFTNVFKRFMSGQTGEAISLVKGTGLNKTYNTVFKGEYKLANNGTNANWININTEHDVEKFDNLKVLVWVQDNATKKVLQSIYATEINLGVNDITKSINADVYPNPTNGVTSVRLDLALNSDVDFTLTNATGQVVNTEHMSSVNAGPNSLTLDLSNHIDGVYFLTIRTNEGSTTKKISVTK